MLGRGSKPSVHPCLEEGSVGNRPPSTDMGLKSVIMPLSSKITYRNSHRNTIYRQVCLYDKNIPTLVNSKYIMCSTY